nr:IclR family transcriptional regulator [Brevibacterium sp. RIT 803]
MNTTLLKGLKMLELLARSEKSRSISELVREFELPKSNVHRTLSALVEAGFVQQDANGKYECTLKLFELGSLITSRIDVRSRAETAMESLAEKTREAVHLGVLEGTDVVYLHKIESSEPIRAYSRVGGRAPAYCVASGKALLAYQADDYLVRFPDELTSYTSTTLNARSDLAEQLTEVRRQRVAINGGEWREEVGGVGAIVFDHNDKPVAAVGVSGPLERIQTSLQVNREEVLAAAHDISQALGCRDYERTVAQWEGRK